MISDSFMQFKKLYVVGYSGSHRQEYLLLAYRFYSIYVQISMKSRNIFYTIQKHVILRFSFLISRKRQVLICGIS